MAIKQKGIIEHALSLRAKLHEAVSNKNYAYCKELLNLLLDISPVCFFMDIFLTIRTHLNGGEKELKQVSFSMNTT